VRTAALVLAAVAALGGACGKGAGGAAKSLVDGDRATRHHVIGDVEVDVSVPAALPAPVASAADVRYQGDVGGDKVELTIAVGSASPLQNAINAQEALSRRLSRTDQTADGWAIAANDTAGGLHHAARQIQKDKRAITCTATVTWKTPGHDAKRTAFVDSLCQSVTATKF
jgi:hypothetical protein